MATLAAGDRARVRNRQIGFIFQAFNLIGDLTVQENVELPLTYRGMSADERTRRVKDALERVGMAHRMRHYPSQLSGGQQQRVAIARSFANDPVIILADEPTGNLDTKTGEAIIDRLSHLSRERGVTIISATHDHKMLAVSDRVVTIRDGLVDKIELREQLNIQLGSIDDMGGAH